MSENIRSLRMCENIRVPHPPGGSTWFSLALGICESRAIFFVSSKYVNLIRVFLCDDALHELSTFRVYLGQRFCTSKMHSSPMLA